ncbi:hypothetical protein KR084_005923, partial [Drosophila pseudotakahashii]
NDNDAKSHDQNKRKDMEEPRNTFWISVSDYELDRAYIVYRFFHDIGNIVAKSFTKTNRMYLKYFSLVDSQIALSYDGQKIGYGGDIRVKVRAENPVTESALIEALEHSSQDNGKPPDSETTSTRTVTIDVRGVNEVTPYQLESGQSEKEEYQIVHKKVSLLQWFKEKLAYLFYFY